MTFSDFIKDCVVAGGGAGAERVLARLVSVSIQLAVLIVLLLALRAVFKRRISPVLRYALWGVVALRALIPVSIASPLSVFGLFAAPAAEAAFAAQTVTAAAPTAAYAPALAANTYTAAAGYAAEAAGVLPEAGAGPAGLGWTGAALVVWACGMALMAAYILFVNARYYRRVLRGLRRSDVDAPVPVYTADIPSPCLMLIRGRCSVVLNGAARQDPLTTSLVMKHELAHRRQGDLIWAVVRNVVNTIFWFHPLVWAAAAVSRRDCELSADALAMRAMDDAEREEYGMALIRMIRRGAKRELVCASTAMTDSGAEMKERITHIAEKKKPALLVAALTLALALAVCAVACTSPGEGSPGAADNTADTADTADTAVPPQPPASDPAAPAQALTEPDEASEYTLTYVVGGVPTARANVSGDDAELVRSAVFDHMVRSAAWPVEELDEQDTYIEIIERHSDGTQSSYRAFVGEDGQPRMASGSLWGFITVTSYNDPATLLGAETIATTNDGETAAGPLAPYPGSVGMATGTGLVTPDAAADTGLITPDMAISEAVKSEFRDELIGGDFETEGHEIIFSERSGAVTKYGILAMYSQWGSRDLITFPEGVKLSGTGLIPMLVTIEKTAANDYRILKVQKASDGALYAPSIKEMFPGEYCDAALNPSAETEQALISGQLEQVRQWLEDAGEKSALITFDYYDPATAGEPDPEAAKMVELARTLVGKPYEVNANGPDAFGPAGLIRYLMLKQRRTIPAGGCAELSRYDEWGRIENAAAIQTGDILFFTGSDTDSVQHAGIYIGNGEFIHASSSNNKVVISRFNPGDDGTDGGDYFLRHFSHALRWWY